MFCTHPKTIDEKEQLLRIAESLETVQKRIDDIDRYEERNDEITYSMGSHLTELLTFSSEEHTTIVRICGSSKDLLHVAI